MAAETADQPLPEQGSMPSGTNGRRTASDVRPGVSGSICLFREAELTPERAIETLTVLESLIGWAQAQRAKVISVIERQVRDEAQNTQGLDSRADLGAVARLGVSMAESLAAAEVACALRVPERTALALLQDSLALCKDYPATLEALTWGKINYPQALTIIEEAALLPLSAQEPFEAALLERAQHMTRAQLSRVARREREKYHPETIQERRAKVVEGRSVEVQPDQDGMCWLSAHLPAEIGIGIYNNLTTLAQQCQGPDEPRTLAQLRADVFGDLLTGKSSAKSAGEPLRPQPRFAGPEVLVTIDVATLAGLSDHAGNLEGYGPLSPDVARGIAALAGFFTPLLTDERGNLLAIGRKRRLPAPIVRRWLRVRDETCRYPGCRRSAAKSEIDHLIPWAKVHDTHHTGLAHLCKKHHRFKTLTRWKVVQDRTGWLTWTSPCGGKYTTAPAVDIAPPRSTAKQSPEHPPQDNPPPF